MPEERDEKKPIAQETKERGGKRKGAGRRKLDRRQLTTRVPGWMYQLIEAIANKKQKSISEVAEELLTEAVLQKYEDPEKSKK